jgi:hypothetical protein
MYARTQERNMGASFCVPGLELRSPGVVTAHSDAIALSRQCTGGSFWVNCECSTCLVSRLTGDVVWIVFTWTAAAFCQELLFARDDVSLYGVYSRITRVPRWITFSVNIQTPRWITRAASGVAGLRYGSGQHKTNHALMSETSAGKPQPKAIPLNIQVRHEFSPFSCPIFLGHSEARGRCSQGERVLYGRGPSG